MTLRPQSEERENSSCPSDLPQRTLSTQFSSLAAEHSALRSAQASTKLQQQRPSHDDTTHRPDQQRANGREQEELQRLRQGQADKEASQRHMADVCSELRDAMQHMELQLQRERAATQQQLQAQEEQSVELQQQLQVNLQVLARKELSTGGSILPAAAEQQDLRTAEAHRVIVLQQLEQREQQVQELHRQLCDLQNQQRQQQSQPDQQATVDELQRHVLELQQQQQQQQQQREQQSSLSHAAPDQHELEKALRRQLREQQQQLEQQRVGSAEMEQSLNQQLMQLEFEKVEAEQALRQDLRRLQVGLSACEPIVFVVRSMCVCVYERVCARCACVRMTC